MPFRGLGEVLLQLSDRGIASAYYLRVAKEISRAAWLSRSTSSKQKLSVAQLGMA